MRKKAFTLAEVLITLGIIGVVAALTIPTLISNFQKRSYVSSLQKNYANLQNGFKLMAATEGVDYLEQTQFWKDMKKGNFSNESVAESVNNNMSKYFKISESYEGGADSPYKSYMYYYLDGREYGQAAMYYPHAILQDGTAIVFDFSSGSLYFFVDVNGVKEPNTFGRDVFAFTLADIGPDGEKGIMQLLPYGQYMSLYSVRRFLSYSKMSDSLRDCGELGSDNIDGERGYQCIDRIIEEGWKMNY